MFAKFAHPKKSRTRKFQTTKKIVRSSLSLEIRSAPPPLGNPLQATSGARYRRYILQDFDSVSSSVFNQPGHSITDKELILFELQPTLSMSRRKAREAYLIKIEAKLFHQTI